MKKNPLITVVTVVLNAKETLVRTIDSVVEQKYKHFEYLIIDGASTDGTLDIIKKYAAKEHNFRWYSEQDNGIYNAMNKAVDLAKGTYLLFLNADDYLVDNRVLERIASQLEKNEPDILSGHVYFKDMQGRLFPRPRSSKDIARFLSKKNWIHHQGVFSKRVLLKRFPFDTSYRVCADIDFICRAYFAKKRFVLSHTKVSVWLPGGFSGRHQRTTNIEHNKLILKYFGVGNFLLAASKDKYEDFDQFLGVLGLGLKSMSPQLYKFAKGIEKCCKSIVKKVS